MADPTQGPQDELQAILRHVAADLVQQLAVTYPEMAQVRPSKIQEAAIAAARDAESYGPILECMASPRASSYAVQIDFIRPPVIEGAEEKMVAQIMGHLDPQKCENANQLMQCVTVLGLLTSPAARSRLYLSGVRMNLRLCSYKKAPAPS
jgi:hypothetical protein